MWAETVCAVSGLFVGYDVRSSEGKRDARDKRDRKTIHASWRGKVKRNRRSGQGVAVTVTVVTVTISQWAYDCVPVLLEGAVCLFCALL